MSPCRRVAMGLRAVAGTSTACLTFTELSHATSCAVQSPKRMSLPSCSVEAVQGRSAEWAKPRAKPRCQAALRQTLTDADQLSSTARLP